MQRIPERGCIDVGVRPIRASPERLRSSKVKVVDLPERSAVLGIHDRGGHIGAHVIDNRLREIVVPAVHENVEAASLVYTDQLRSYFGLCADYEHDVINHAEM